jgi:hypothetical protein
MSETLLEACNDELGPSMGRVYRDVVRGCLEGNLLVEGLSLNEEEEPNWEELDADTIAALEAKDEKMNGDLTTSFYWKVVKELGKLYA